MHFIEKTEETEREILLFMKSLMSVDLSQKNEAGAAKWSLVKTEISTTIALPEQSKAVALFQERAAQLRDSENLQGLVFHISMRGAEDYETLYNAIREKVSQEIERRNKVNEALRRFIREFLE